MSDTLQGVARAISFGAANTERTIGLTEMGAVQTQNILPKYAELTRLGKIYSAKHTVATAVAPLQVVPTTTAAFVVYNADTGSSAKNLVILRCAIYLGSGTNGIGAAVFAGVSGGPLATPITTDLSGVTRGQGLGAGQATSVAYGDTSETVVASWDCIGGFDANPAAAVPGACKSFDLDGQYIVRPTYAFMLHALAGAGTSAAYCYSVTWAELPITVSI